MAGERRGSWGLRDVRRAFKDTQYTDMENLVRTATSNDDMGPDEELLTAIAKRVTRANYYELSNVLWKRINDLSYPRHVLKGLELLHFLLRDQRLQRQIAIDCNLRVGVLEKLLQYWNSKGKYKGTHVREEARKILKLLEELNKKVKEEKEAEEKLQKEKETKKKEKPQPEVKDSPSKPKKKKLAKKKPAPAPETLTIPKATTVPVQQVSVSEPSSPVAKPKTADELFFDDLLDDDIFGDKIPSNASTPASTTDIFFQSSPGPKNKSITQKEEEPRDDLDALIGDGLGAKYKSLENKKDDLDDEEAKRRAKEERLRKAQELREKERQAEEEAEEKLRREKEERLRRAAEARKAKDSDEKERKEREERERKEREERDRLAKEERDRRDREDKERRDREELERRQRAEELARMQRERDEERLRQQQALEREKQARDEAERRRLSELDAERLRLEKLRLETEAQAKAQREALEQQLEAMRREKEAMERSMREKLDSERQQRDLLAQEKALTEERLKERERLEKEAEELRKRQSEDHRKKLEQERLEREKIEQDLREAALRTKQELEARSLAERENFENQLLNERLAREKLTQDLKDREAKAEQERLERERQEEEARKAKLLKEQEEKDRLAKLDAERKNSIKFIDENIGKELAAYARYLNGILGKDESGTVKHLLPLRCDNDKQAGLDLLLKVRDGSLLALFINSSVPDTIDLRVLNKQSTESVLTEQECQENINLVINAAKAIGVRTKTVAEEVLDATGSQHRVVATTDFIWELVRFHLLVDVNLSKHPELLILSDKKDGDDAQERMLTLNRLPGDELLLRWSHHHLASVQTDRSSRSLPNQAGYLSLLPKLLAFKTGQEEKKSQSFAEFLQQLDVKFVIDETDTTHDRLNLALAASVFNSCSGLDIKKDQAQTERLKKELEMLEKLSLEGSSKGGEQVAFRLWINSLNLTIDVGKYAKTRGRASISGLLESEARQAETREVFVHDLFHDLRDGLFLLRIIDHIIPGSVQWSQVEMNPDSRFKKVGNCNYAIAIGQKLNLVLVGIGGVDLVDGSPKLTLALVWQLMRLHLIEFFKQLRTKAKERTSDQKSRLTGRRVSLDMSTSVEQDFDTMLLNWANKTVKVNESTNGLKATSELDKKSVRQMSSFRDPNIQDSLFFLDLLFAVSPRVVDWRQVAVGRKLPVKDCVLNARYTISAARKLGCTIFVLPEHIVSLKPQMILTLIASIMTVAIA